MAEGKKFGTFGGVFTPSLLTILGVIMYLRMGWIAGNAGLEGVIFIILVAHFISVSTGLSISSIATDKKVGAGGVYYVLSRSLGLPIGGALGMTLFTATALSIALYMVGFAEIFNEYIGFGFELNSAGELVKGENMLNSYRITGSLGLLFLTVIAFISTSIAIKSQYFILTAIGLSLIAIFCGHSADTGPEVVAVVAESDKVGFAALFAIFFPAVTGFTAGVAMSGDLKDPKRSIPVGTMGAIAVGLVVYITLGIFLTQAMDENTLINNEKAMFDYAAVGILVYLGVWGATLSSALGGILGGPRILQAMSVDKLTPKIFAKGVGKSNEPRNALILTVLIAEAGILIGDLNVIAEVVSMFYLAAYGFINLSFFLESWASSDFNPTFKVKKWIGLFGFIATFTVMAKLNLLAMVVAFIIIGGIYFYLSRKQIALGTGDIWQSVWSTIVKKGLKRMEGGVDHKRNWKPNTLLFSTDNEQRSKMIEFSKAISGRGGIITNFDLHENPEAKVLFPKSKEAVQDEELEKYGIFGRKLEVQNVFKGIESIACTFGFSGIEPNTVLMNWPGETNDPIWFKEMTEKLIELDYNVLYLDYDKRWGFRKKEKIDLWWRGVGNNAELMLSLAKFITASPDWSQANIRILLVNDTNVDFKVVENRIRGVVEQFRVTAEIKVINNEVDSKPIYDLMKVHSSEADLVFVGIPEIQPDEREEFVERTNNLVSIIGTTLLVKASSKFDETDLKLEQISLTHKPRIIEKNELLTLKPCEDEEFGEVLQNLDRKFDTLAIQLIQLGVQPVEDYHHAIFSKVIGGMDNFLLDAAEDQSPEQIQQTLQAVLSQVKAYYADAIENQLPLIFEALDAEVKHYFTGKEELITYLPKNTIVSAVPGVNGTAELGKRKVPWRYTMQRVWFAEGIADAHDALLEFGYQNLILLHQSKNILHQVVWKLLANLDGKNSNKELIADCKRQLDDLLSQVDGEAQHLASNLYFNLRNKEREKFNNLADAILTKKFTQRIELQYSLLPNKKFQQIRKGTTAFPSYWYRNLILFTYHLQADIYLIAYTAKIQGLVNRIKQYSTHNYVQKIETNLQNLTNQLDNLENLIASDKQKEVLGTVVRLSEELFFNADHVISLLLSGVNEMNAGVPIEIELMKAKSINGIREAQGEEIETEKIALKDFTEYIARTHFVDPVHERVQIFYEQLKRAAGKLVSTAAVVQKGIDNYAFKGEIEGLKDAIQVARTETRIVRAELETTEEGFNSELKDRRELLRKELDVNQIIEQIETLRQYIKQHKRRNVLLDRFQEVNKKATKKVGNLLDYLAQKKQDISSIEYKERYATVISEQGAFANFVQAAGPQIDLPFFYQQLFTGTHYTDSKTIDNRRVEIERIKEGIGWIDDERSGAIMVTGSAGSGKTYLIRHVSGHLLSGSLYKIVPPSNRTWTKEDITNALQKATGINESIGKILTKLPAKSSIIFEDIEQWWLKTDGGDLVLNELAKIIHKYGKNHYFILSSNIHAYELICRSTTIQSAVLKSVILAPLNTGQIKDAIWSRHQTTGLRIRLDNEKEQHLSVNKLNRYLSRFHTLSNGNVGLAMQLWINAIYKKEDTNLMMGNPALGQWPVVESPEWKNLIFQLFVHKNIGHEALYRIYGEESKNWINRVLQSMITAGLIEQNERGEFRIIKTIKPHIENWLNELGFIK